MASRDPGLTPKSARQRGTWAEPPRDSEAPQCYLSAWSGCRVEMVLRNVAGEGPVSRRVWPGVRTLYQSHWHANQVCGEILRQQVGRDRSGKSEQATQGGHSLGSMTRACAADMGEGPA